MRYLIILLFICSMNLYAESFKLPSPEIVKIIEKNLKQFPGITKKEVIIRLWQESRYKNYIHEDKKSKGLGGIRDIAVRDVCQYYKIKYSKDLLKPEYNIKITIAYLSLLKSHYKFKGDDVLIGYSIGPTATIKLKKQGIKQTKYTKESGYWAKKYDLTVGREAKEQSGTCHSGKLLRVFSSRGFVFLPQEADCSSKKGGKGK